MLDIDPNQKTTQAQSESQNQKQTWNPSQGATPQTIPKERNTQTSKTAGTVLFTTILAVFMIIVGAGVWGLVYYKNQRISQVEKEIGIQDTQLRKLKNIEQEALALQAQYKNVKNVLERRQIWDPLIKVLGDETLKKAVFSNLTAENTTKNMMSLTGSTDSLTSLAKLMVAFQNSENFTDFELTEMSLPSKDNPRINFSIELRFKKEIITANIEETEE